MIDEKIYPVLITGEKGEGVAAAVTNEKGYKKSIENSQLWILHEETHRLIPYNDDRFETIELAKNYLIVKYQDNPILHKDNDFCGKPVDIVDNSCGKPTQVVLQDKDILSTLVDLIHKRRLEMPEGSYTTHLFKSGISKIRKKTGEEAVELLLATDKNDIIGEAADLIFHMLVLLEQESINLNDVFVKLKERHSK